MFPCNHWMKPEEANILLDTLQSKFFKVIVQGKNYLTLKEEGEVLDRVIAVTENRASVVIEYRIDDKLNSDFWEKRYPCLKQDEFTPGKKHRVTVSLSGDEPSTVIPSRAWRDFRFMVRNFPDISDDHKFGCTPYEGADGREHIYWKILDDVDETKKTSAIIGFNPKYRFRHIDDTYYYDRNSAFTYSLMNCILPDMKHPVLLDHDPVRGVKRCAPDEIGYWWNPDQLCYMASEKVGNIIFKRLPDDDIIRKELRHWGEYYYLKKKKYPSGTKEHKQAKDTLNITIGYMQRKNPFFRISTITYCNRLMMKAIRDCQGKAIYWNTDGLITDGPISCFKLSPDMGDWKIEKHGGFYMDGITYQLDGEDPVQRGIPKGWYKRFKEVNGRDFDLSKDAVPDERYNLYKYKDGKFTEVIK